MPGDVIELEVYAKYLDNNANNWTQALTSLMTQIAQGTAPTGTLVDGGIAGSIGGGQLPFIPINHGTESGDAPKAYLNYIVFNKDMNVPLDFGFRRITTAAREYGQDGPHERLAFDGNEKIEIKEAGYVYIYLSNENNIPVEVYFDDFKVTHTKSPIIQSDDYYPFGLAFNFHQRENSVDQRFKYQGNEQLHDLGLTLLMTDFRTFDPTIGRLWQIDLIDKEDLSPYSWAANNPILYIDLLGLDTLNSNDKNFNWDDVKPGDVVDGAAVLDEVQVSAQGHSSTRGYVWIDGYGYYMPGEKVLSRRDGVPGLEDFFGHRSIPGQHGDHLFDAEGRFMPNVSTGDPGLVGGPIKVISSVKKYSDLLKIARKLGESPQMRAELNKLIRELARGNFGAGRGAKNLKFGGVHEMRGFSEGGRVYFRNTKNGIEIVGYSDKATQPAVIETLKKLYGN